MDVQSIMLLNCESLRNKLRELGLETTGLKQELRDRLLQHFGLQTDRDDSESLSSDYQEIGAAVSTGVRNSGPFFTLKDIADSLSTFSGTDSLDVRHWVEDFEENSETVGWNSIQKFIYGKQLLTGAAKLFVRSQSGLRDWEALKNALIEEFGETLSASEVHKLLRNRRKNKSESYREYLYALMEIGKPIKLDVPSLLDYFVEGIPDSRFNKSILYQAKTIAEMKEQIKVYEKIRGSFVDKRMSNVEKPSNSEKPDVKEEQVEKAKKKNCFKCGNPGHIAKDCGETVFKCFKCNKVGHKATNCQVTKPDDSQERGNVNVVDYDQMPNDPGLIYKKVELFDFEMYALIDTGCNISTIRDDVYEKVSAVFEFVPESRRLKGAGAGVFYTRGYFEAPVTIDNITVELKLYVVSASDIGYPAVLGTNLLQLLNLSVNEEGVKFTSKSVRSKDLVFKEYANTSKTLSEHSNIRVNIVQTENSRILKENGIVEALNSKERKIVRDEPSSKVVGQDDLPKVKVLPTGEKLKVEKCQTSKVGPDGIISEKVVDNTFILNKKDKFIRNNTTERDLVANKRIHQGAPVCSKIGKVESIRSYKEVSYPEVKSHIKQNVAMKPNRMSNSHNMRSQYKNYNFGEVDRPRERFTVTEQVKQWRPVFEANTLSGRPNVGLGPNHRSSWWRKG